MSWHVERKNKAIIEFRQLQSELKEDEKKKRGKKWVGIKRKSENERNLGGKQFWEGIKNNDLREFCF